MDLSPAQFSPGREATGSRPAVEFAKFEQDKENLRPKKSGRSATVLSQVYHSPERHSSPRERRIEAARAKFEAKIAALDEEQDDSAVEVWERYATWAAEWHPASDREEKDILERATKFLAARPQFKEDLAHLKLWIRLADQSKDPQEIYNYLFTNEIGSTHVLFYEHWALYLVLQKRWDEAAEAVRVGMARRAKPRSRMVSCREKVQQAISAQVVKADPGSPSDPVRPTFNPITDEEAKQLHRPAQRRPNQQRAPGASTASRAASKPSQCQEPAVLPDASYASPESVEPAFPMLSSLSLGDSLPLLGLKFFGNISDETRREAQQWQKQQQENRQRSRTEAPPKSKGALMKVVGPAGFGRLAEVPFDEYDDYDDFGQYPQIRTKPNKPVEEPKPQGKTKVETRTPDRKATIDTTPESDGMDSGIQTEKMLMKSILSASWLSPPKPEAVAKKENNQAIHAAKPFMLEEPGWSPQRRGRGRGKGAGKNRQRPPKDIQIYVDEDLHAPEAPKLDVTPAKSSKRSAKGSSKGKSPVTTPKSSEPARNTPGAPIKESRKRRASTQKTEQDHNSASLAASLSQLQLEEPPKKRAKAKKSPKKDTVEEQAPHTPPCKPRSAKKGNHSVQRSAADEPCWSPPRTSPRRGQKTRSSKSRSGGSMKSEIDPEGLAALRAVQDVFAQPRGSTRSCSRFLVFED